MEIFGAVPSGSIPHIFLFFEALHFPFSLYVSRIMGGNSGTVTFVSLPLFFDPSQSAAKALKLYPYFILRTNYLVTAKVKIRYCLPPTSCHVCTTRPFKHGLACSSSCFSMLRREFRDKMGGLANPIGHCRTT